MHRNQALRKAGEQKGQEKETQAYIHTKAGVDLFVEWQGRGWQERK